MKMSAKWRMRRLASGMAKAAYGGISESGENEIMKSGSGMAKNNESEGIENKRKPAIMSYGGVAKASQRRNGEA
jgi:hypothetical protein